jgi:hypothetical protein
MAFWKVLTAKYNWPKEVPEDIEILAILLILET